MKFAIIFVLIIMAAVVLLFTIAMNPLQSNIANETIVESNASGANMSNFAYWDNLIGMWPFIPIILIVFLIFVALYKHVKAK